MKVIAFTAILALTQARLLHSTSVNLAQLASDPIHGSLGPPKVDPANLTPE